MIRCFRSRLSGRGPQFAGGGTRRNGESGPLGAGPFPFPVVPVSFSGWTSENGELWSEWVIGLLALLPFPFYSLPFLFVKQCGSERW